MSIPAIAGFSPIAGLTTDDCQILEGVARGAPIRYRATSTLAEHGLVASDAHGFAVITLAGRRACAAMRSVSTRRAP